MIHILKIRQISLENGLLVYRHQEICCNQHQKEDPSNDQLEDIIEVAALRIIKAAIFK